MMKKKNQVLVSLSIVALLGGCSEEQVQRDVYNSLVKIIAAQLHMQDLAPLSRAI